MAYEVLMPYHLHMPSYFLGTFTEYPFLAYLFHIFVPRLSPREASGDKILSPDIFWTHTTSNPVKI